MDCTRKVFSVTCHGPLAALDLLARIVTAGLAARRRLDARAFNHSNRRLRIPTSFAIGAKDRRPSIRSSQALLSRHS